MTIRRLVALAIVTTLAMSGAPSLVTAAPQGGGASISGHAGDAKPPYTNFSIRLIDPLTGQVLATVPLDANGNFVFTGLVPKSYIIQLFDLTAQPPKPVCQKGPFELTPNIITKADVDLNCGITKGGAALLTAGLIGGVVATVVAVEIQSPSR